MGEEFSKGFYIRASFYLNIPLVYMQFYEDFKSIFRVKKEYVKIAQETVANAIQNTKYSAIIGVHVRRKYLIELWK